MGYISNACTSPITKTPVPLSQPINDLEKETEKGKYVSVGIVQTDYY